MKLKTKLVPLALALVLALPGLSAHAQSAPDPTGTWDIEVDMGGTPLLATLVVNKNDDGTFSGTLNSPMGEMSLEKVDYTPGESITFEETVGEGDTAMSFKFDGKFSGPDTFEGQLVSEALGEMAVKGKRGGAAENPMAGVWDVTSDSQLGKLERKLVVYKNGSGKYVSEDAEYKVAEVAVTGSDVTFAVTVSAQGQDLPLTFKGTQSGDALNGNFSMDGNDVAVVTGKKSNVDILAASAGVWDLTAETPLGPLEAKLEVGPGAAGKMISAEGESPLSAVGADGDMLEFEVDVLFQGESHHVTFEGFAASDSIKGEFIMDGSPVADVVCVRAAK